MRRRGASPLLIPYTAGFGSGSVRAGYRAFRMPPSRSRRSYTLATKGLRSAETPGGTPIWARIGHIRPEWQVTGAAEHRACCKGRTGSAVLLRRRAEGPVRKDLGPWRVLRRRGGLTNDRGPQADAEERIRSAHRAIEIREKRRRVLSSLCLDLPCAPADVERERRAGHRARHRLVERRTPLSARHRWS